VNPGSDGGKEALEDMASRVKLQLRSMVVVGGPHRTDNRQIVNAISHVRPPVTDLDAALATLPVPHLRGEELRHQLSLARDEFHDILFGKRGIQNSLVRGILDGLPCVPLQHRLRIKRLDVAHTAQHEKPDDALCSGSEMGLSVGWQPFAATFSPHHPVTVQHCAQHKACKPHPAVSEKDTTIDPAAATGLSNQWQFV
jgi:hypothetical protein